ncbi:Superoxide dismutase [Fe] [Candidatus Entotheonellaceae bacterium PAL068K]
MAFTLPELPYANDALQPHISAETIEFHYGRHHQTYVNNLNNLTQGTPDTDKSLEDLIRTAAGGVFNNAAQVWNHTFYWNCLSPSGGGAPSGEVASAINQVGGSFESFKESFSNAAITLFGSGWAWLAKDSNGTISIESMANAGNPLRDGKTPLLTLDVWEHAYYIDYRNARPSYVNAFWNLVNWDFVAQNLSS